ncbi:MAG: tyrosine-type recombinase/integrase [Paracoccus sp. (in: a-proteobacteria)]|uniref:tyrosine-type recombinase/integrase n=1 Tax=Paracoccus sp. TaxID=267 RepID=UPI0026DF602B|nr:site-specific integrase [Paracoccus sp. (in: a-proteobacteria)]MDO5631633.1 tyrosine-type recombinase/integrase [Paracoccus sp. (in: a-proteobacteria)]
MTETEKTARTCKLTKASVDRLIREHQGKRVDWTDTVTPGFILRVSDGGASFAFRYRVGGGRGARMRKETIGKVGAITLDAARKRAQALAAEVTQGGDPSGDKAKWRANPTVAELMLRYLTDHAEPHKKARSAAGDRLHIANRINPAIGSMKVSDIAPADIERLHLSGRATPYLANRVLALLSKAFSLAEKWRVRDRGTNPCRDVTRFPERKRERALSPDEVASFGATLDLAETAGSLHMPSGRSRQIAPAAVLAVRLILLTGARRGEILSLRWDYVDLARGRLVLPDSKTGAKVIPIGPMARRLLDAAPRVAGNPFVIVGEKPGSHLVDIKGAWDAIRTHAGLPDLRLHDLRHGWASVAVETGASLRLVGGQLGHTQAATTQRYAHVRDDPARQLVDEVERAIARDLAGGGKVVPFRGRE